MKTYPPSKDRRNIGKVVFPIEKMMRARELSSGCIGVEAMLENDSSVYTANLQRLDHKTRKEREQD